MPEAASSETIREPAMRFTLCQRISLWLITWTAYLFIRLLCSTLRYSISFEDDEPARDPVHGIYSFWHRCIVPASFGFRNRNVAVMTSRSYDGEYIARIIELFGFRAVRGSSSRGAVGALLGMRRELEEGRRVVFTIDGPRGPKYVAKS